MRRLKMETFLFMCRYQRLMPSFFVSYDGRETVSKFVSEYSNVLRSFFITLTTNIFLPKKGTKKKILRLYWPFSICAQETCCKCLSFVCTLLPRVLFFYLLKSLWATTVATKFGSVSFSLYYLLLFLMVSRNPSDFESCPLQCLFKVLVSFKFTIQWLKSSLGAGIGK